VQANPPKCSGRFAPVGANPFKKPNGVAPVGATLSEGLDGVVAVIGNSTLENFCRYLRGCITVLYSNSTVNSLTAQGKKRFFRKKVCTNMELAMNFMTANINIFLEKNKDIYNFIIYDLRF
jgi:hypothetical protein